ncbi:MAG: hypothetical protein AAF214_11100 [Pseudomonadota bacterium]
MKRRLTSMHVPHLKLGQTAAEMMVARLSGEAVHTTKSVKFHLIPGATVRPASD